MLSTFGIPAYLFEEWEVNSEAETGIPSRPDLFPFQIWFEKIEKCNVALVFNTTGRLAIEGIEEDLLRSIEALLWVCARLNRWVWLMDFRMEGLEDTPPYYDDVVFIDYFKFCSKFFKEGDVWCFLPKPIFENLNTDIKDRLMVFFSGNEEDGYEYPLEVNNHPIIIGDDGSFVFVDTMLI